MVHFGPHLLGIRGLTREQAELLLSTAQEFVEVSERAIKKVPTLRGRTTINLFLEPSTRTRSSFEIAAKRLSADAINIGGRDSSVSKGESLYDTALNLQAMKPEVIVMRHPSAGAPHFLAKFLKNSVVVNAGDGWNEHPSQAFLDALSIRQRLGRNDKLKVVFVGDILRARVFRSNAYLNQLFGNEMVAVGPPTLVSSDLEALGVRVEHSLERALEGADVVMSLRVKTEYAVEALLPHMDEYARKYCLSEKHFQKYCPNALLAAPGPIVRGTDMTTDLADSPRSLISQQVTNGVAVRMAILYLLVSHNAERFVKPGVATGEVFEAGI